jgi:serine/threonine-protein phosphatase 2A regulatory subunit B
LWDVRNTKSPVKTYNVTDYLEKKLCEVYESETIFDKFDMNLSPDSNLIVTGAYNSNLHVLDLKNQTNTTIEVKYMEKRGKNVGFMRPYKGKRVQGIMTNANGEPVKVDMNSKILKGAWHPKDNTFAVSKNNSLFIYSEKKSSSNTYNNHSVNNNMIDN